MTPLFSEFQHQVSQTTNPADWPLAQQVDQNVLIYNGDTIRELPPAKRSSLMHEWAKVLASGPGVIAIRNAFADTAVIDTATRVFESIIEREKSSVAGGGADHFAKRGANDRIWNALQKHCLADPANYTAYYSNEILDAVSRAWLGDGYKTTAQVNRVNPGGAAQTAHRDYHLGFMSRQRMAEFPEHIHRLSPVLTLQGAVAHCDMPVETGPTLYLPYSQLFTSGYTHFNEPKYQDYFNQHHSQLPLEKGDAVFFNPAVMHAAGSNITSDMRRTANLLQISSAFGRAMEAIDHISMVKTIYPIICKNNSLSAQQITAVISATADGYAFPTNLDTDPPDNGMSPETQADLFTRALSQAWSTEQFYQAVDAQAAKRLA
ncbi:phytanoyl-CoA dioxygenase [Chromatiales bacterium (ex Bugula neritina AB1)]|nr:phytanoyl-CoA dioxygenase [Chromatiales bacterium (ex Bugula neritina AB1)]